MAVMTITAPQVYAADNEVVRVAYFNMGDYYTVLPSGDVDSYDTEYLKKVSEYTDIQFEFVNCTSWEQALNMLANHEIDLLGTMQLTDKRAEEFAFCTSNYGITFAALAALPERGYVYEDYEQIKNSKIGCSKDYVRKIELVEMLKNKGIEPDITYYENADQAVAALENGEIDILAANSHTFKSEWTLLDKYLYTPFYFATWKGNEQLTDRITEAILKMDLYESDYINDITIKYLPALINAPFSKSELDFISQSVPMTFYFEDNTSPLAYVDDNNKMSGIIIETSRLIAEKTGLKLQFEAIDYENTELQDNEYTFVVTQSGSIKGKQADGSYLTQSIFDCEYQLYGKIGGNYDFASEKEYTVAIPFNRSAFKFYFDEHFPSYNIIECDTPSECIDLVTRGKADLCFLNYYVANSIIVKDSVTNIIGIPTISCNMGISIKIRGENAETIASVINKGANLITSTESQKLILDHALNIVPDVTLDYFVRTSPVAFAIIIIVFAAAVTIAMVLSIHARMLGRQKKALAASNKKLEKASTAKTDFLSRMSHDIRTPMNAIIGMTAIAKNDLDNKENVADCIDKIDSSSHFLLGLINDILDMIKIESKVIELHPEPYLISDFVNQLNTLIVPLCNQKNLTFNFEAQDVSIECVLLDKLRFNQIFFNLLSNAIKFTPDGGRIDFIVQHLEVTEKTIKKRFIVRDTGIGMSQEFLDHLFEPFSQESSAIAKESTGTGLGLAIVKNLVDLMGGTISVKSQKGHGTEFTVELEVEICDAPTAEAMNKATVPEQCLKGRKILLCEDHPLNTQIAVKLLSIQGAEVTACENGLIGYERFKASDEFSYDAVLMDIRMPVMNGLNTAEAIRKTNRKDSALIPIVAMTANAYDEDIQKSLKAGMNAHLAKPIQPEKLYDTLYNLINEYSINKEKLK